jgi:hypothetical protein
VPFADLRPSTSWAALKYKGTAIAEAWFKPDGEPSGLIFRIPHESLQAHTLTTERLLNAVAIEPDDVEAWRLEGASDAVDFSHDVSAPLPPPSDDRGHLLIHVRLKSTDVAESRDERERQERLQDLEVRWKVLVGLESTIESMRLRMEGTRAEMEATAKRPLAAEEKLHALQADVVQLNREKNRIHYALPKAKEFIHRATWMLGAPDRKQLEESYTKFIESPATNPEPRHLEIMIKERNLFITQGNTVLQECRSVIAGVQAAIRTLQTNAMAQARKKKPAR